ncbi:oncostatin-M-specific receptor subunit beta [Pelobates fuscus]|uniref:oncostatin-M-specific receptor subunit beta n=1 Tax=Pelobates fuscus TaxID=191477 RepID=UPI002FE4F6EC
MDPIKKHQNEILALVLVLNFRFLHCQDIDVLHEPLNLKLYNVSSQQRLIVKWNVNNTLHASDSDIVFHIQVSRANETNIICNHNYSTHISTTKQTFQWTWDSELPLECESHSVRIRWALVRQEGWSAWSAWQTHHGENNYRSKPIIYPHEKIVHEGSSVSFCCIPVKNQYVRKIQFKSTSYNMANGSPGTAVITVKNVSISASDGTNFICFCNGSYNGTVLFVSKPPDQPSNISCETQDLKTLKCTWYPGALYNFDNKNGDGKMSPKYTLHEWISQKTSVCSARDSCSWTIEKNRAIYNFTLTAENQLGKRSVNTLVNVTESVRPFTPERLSVINITARSATLRWSLKVSYKDHPVLCQIGLQKSTGDEELINKTIHGTSTSECISRLGKGTLHPYTTYTVKVRCAVISSLPKWSKWCKSITIRTLEDVPTAPLDIWREVNESYGDRMVTLHWKPLTAFHANGYIQHYNVTWQSLGELSKPQFMNVFSPENSTHISIDSKPSVIRVTALNAAGSSPESEIRIPALSKDGFDQVQEEMTHNEDDGIFISWTSNPNLYHGYVVEWCNYPREDYCDLQWKKFNSSIHQHIIKSNAFRPGVRYHFQIYGSALDGEHLLERKAGYIEELAPSNYPRPKIGMVEPDIMHLEWKDYAINDLQEGFIRGYNIHIKPPEGICELKKSEADIVSGDSQQCTFFIQDPLKKTFTIKQLKPNTKYEVAVAAVTKGGESSFAFGEVLTPSDTNGAILAMVVPVVIFLITALMLLVVGCWKRKTLKNFFYPDIPSPNKSNILSFDTSKDNSRSNMIMLPTSGPTQNIYIVNVQEPKMHKEIQDEKYNGLDIRDYDPYSNDKIWSRCINDTQSELLTDMPHTNPLQQHSYSALNNSQAIDNMEFFNRNYCPTSDDVDETVSNVGYKPQTEIAQLGLQLKAHPRPTIDVQTADMNTETYLGWRNASSENLYSLDIGEMSPLSTDSSAFILKD